MVAEEDTREMILQGLAWTSTTQGHCHFPMMPRGFKRMASHPQGPQSTEGRLVPHRTDCFPWPLAGAPSTRCVSTFSTNVSSGGKGCEIKGIRLRFSLRQRINWRLLLVSSPNCWYLEQSQLLLSLGDTYCFFVEISGGTWGATVPCACRKWWHIAKVNCIWLGCRCKAAFRDEKLLQN